MTPEESDKAYDESPAIPIGDEEVDRLVTIATACHHDDRFRGVIGCQNGCVACELEKVQSELAWQKKKLRNIRNSRW